MRGAYLKFSFLTEAKDNVWRNFFPIGDGLTNTDYCTGHPGADKRG